MGEVSLLGLFLLCLGYMTYRDLKDRIIPDWVVVVCLTLGVLWRLMGDLPLLEGIIGAGVLFFLSFGCSWAYLKVRGKVGLGGGDIKLLAVAGLWLSGFSFPLVPELPWMYPFVGGCCVIQILFATLWQKVADDAEVPFGPVLCMGMALSLIFVG